MIALASAAGIRTSMEDHHAGVAANADAKVIWPGGECLYGEAAKLSPLRLGLFKISINKKLSTDLHRAGSQPTTWHENTSRNLQIALNSTRNWYLPEVDDDLSQNISTTLRQVLPKKATRKDVRDVNSLYNAVKCHHTFINPLLTSMVGEEGPAQAFERGQSVMVETEHGPTPWGNVSHLGDKQMKSFNIGMADYILSAYDAMERVALEYPARQMDRAR
jgi:hypothetical protein